MYKQANSMMVLQGSMTGALAHSPSSRAAPALALPRTWQMPSNGRLVLGLLLVAVPGGSSRTHLHMRYGGDWRGATGCSSQAQAEAAECHEPSTSLKTGRAQSAKDLQGLFCASLERGGRLAEGRPGS